MEQNTEGRFVLEARLQLSPSAENIVNKRFYAGWTMHNKAVKYAKNQLQQLHEDKNYRETLAAYRATKGDEKKAFKEKLNAIVASYRVSEYDLQHYLVEQQHKFCKLIDSNTSQKIASNVYRGVKTILYSNGETLHFKKLSNFSSLEGKDNKMGIMLKSNEDGYYVSWLKLNIPLQVRKNDTVLQTALAENEVSFCKIVRKPFKSGYRYFVQITFRGRSPVKIGKTKGNPVKRNSQKRVGTDIGTSTVAATNGDICILKQLAQGVEKYNEEIVRLSTELEHKRRVANPQNYNDDGTVKRGVKLTWNHTKSYKKTLWRLRDAYRRRSVFITQSHNILANELLEFGSEVYTEKMNFKALAKRKEETVINEKTGLPESKRQFGKSIESRAPGLFTAILARKLKKLGKELHKVDTASFKASQYNHITDTYEKKELNERHAIIDGKKIQRDLYSAFLLMNSNEDLKHTNRDTCLKTYPKFKTAHNRCIREIEKAGQKVPSSFGIEIR